MFSSGRVLGRSREQVHTKWTLVRVSQMCDDPFMKHILNIFKKPKFFDFESEKNIKIKTSHFLIFSTQNLLRFFFSNRSRNIFLELKKLFGHPYRFKKLCLFISDVYSKFLDNLTVSIKVKMGTKFPFFPSICKLRGPNFRNPLCSTGEIELIAPP